MSSYKTGKQLPNGKPQMAVAYFEGKRAIVSFPAKLNNFKLPELNEVPEILAGLSVEFSEGWNTHASAYYIVDDVVTATGKEGYVVMHGNPVAAVGFTQGEYRLLRDAVAAVPAGEKLYRVKLARRYGHHSVTRMRKTIKTV